MTDLAEAHYKALQYLETNNVSALLNLGTGNGVSVQDVIDMVEKVSGSKIQVKSGERRPGDPAKLVASANKARHLLDWRPRHSDLETIIKSALDWHKKKMVK